MPENNQYRASDNSDVTFQKSKEKMKKIAAFILLMAMSVTSFAQLSNASNTSRERSRDESRAVRSSDENRTQNSLDVSLNLNQLILSRYVAIFEMDNYESICKKPKTQFENGDVLQKMKFVTNPLLSFPVVNIDGATPYQWQEIRTKVNFFGNSFDRYLMNHSAVAVKSYLIVSLLSESMVVQTAESLKDLKAVNFDDAKKHVDSALCALDISQEVDNILSKYFSAGEIVCGKEVRYQRDPHRLSCDSTSGFNLNVDADSRTILINGTPTLSSEHIHGQKYVLNYSKSKSQSDSREASRTDSRKSSQSSTKRQSGGQ